MGRSSTTKSNDKQTEPDNRSTNLGSSGDEHKSDQALEDFMKMMVDSLKIFEAKTWATVQANQAQFAMMFDERLRRSMPETIIIDSPAAVDKKQANRQIDKLFAYCDSSYVYFKEEPIEIDEGPGPHKPLSLP